MIPNKGIVKLYYSIKEVANRLGVSESALRTWEREFPNLKPKRNNSGDRKYKEEDIKQIELIINLRKTKKLTVAGAKDYIKAKSHKKIENEDLVNKLKNLKGFLVDLRDNLDNSVEKQETAEQFENNLENLTFLENIEENNPESIVTLESSLIEQAELANLIETENRQVEANNQNFKNIVNYDKIEKEIVDNVEIEVLDSQPFVETYEENAIEENVLELEKIENIQEENTASIDKTEATEVKLENSKNVKGGQQASLF